MWAAIAAIAVPILTAVVAFLPKGGGRLHAHLKEHAEIAIALPPESEARAAVDALVTFEAQALLGRQRVRLARQLNPTYLALSIILVVVTAATLYGLWQWVVLAYGTPWLILAIAVLAVVGFFLVALTAVGFASIYNPPKPKIEK